MFIPDYKARQSLAKKLGLDFDEKMQDWEFEVSDCNRIVEFIREYDEPEWTDKAKESLMEIILDSANDLLNMGRKVEFEKYFTEIEKRLSLNAVLHRETLNYWTENDFEISNKLKMNK